MKKTKHLAGWGRTTFLLMAAVSLLLFMTGVVMFVLPVSELFEMPPAQTSWRHAAGVVHGISTWLFCIMCGRGVWPHVRVMWHKQNETMKWALGLMNLVLLVVIALGGLALLYGSPDLHDWVSPLHFWMGAVCPLVFLAHTWRRFIPSKFEPNL
jgi:divalent metal cation (Fe/Co/Zn/Cd) transporter